MEDASQDAPLAGVKRPREDAAEGAEAGAKAAGGEGEAAAAASARELHPSAQQPSPQCTLVKTPTSPQR